MTKAKLHTPDFTKGNIAKITELFPSCVVETKDNKTGELRRSIDFDQLRQELSDSIVDGPQERYRLDWPGKREALLAANAPIAKTLRPVRAESVNFDTTQNLFIEGDNLDALKLLQETYLGKVKMIYIDPPYNTGNDFIYEDDFAENVDDYFRRSNQFDEDENRLISNKETNGRFHSDWLSMMYSRLKLARNLLSEEGVIFMSIGHEELANLCRICDEIFGADNFCGIFVWEKKKKPSFLNANMGTVTDYIVSYARSRKFSPPFSAGAVEDGKKYPFNNAGNPEAVLNFPVGSVNFRCSDQTIKAQDMSERNIMTKLLDDVTIKDGTNANDFRLRGEWRYSQAKLDQFIRDGDEILISKIPFRPNYINRSGALKKTANLLSYRTNGVPTNEDATEEIRRLFGEDVMSYPKPTGLLKFLTRAATSGDDLILDFFAGSATTADAVMQVNAEDGSRRRFIMVQLDEDCSLDSDAFKAGYDTISALARERIRKAAKLIQKGHRGEQDSDLFGHNESGAPLNLSDLGFRAFAVDTSNMADVYYKPDSIKQDDLNLQVDNIKPGRSAEDILFQILLDWGVDLSLPITTDLIQDKKVHFVDKNVIAACFENGLDDEAIKEIAKRKPLRAVFRDSSFETDAAKINALQIFKVLSSNTELKTI